MASKLIIAEKPSVAAEIAHCVGAYERISNNNGTYCYCGNNYYVTNAIGHLYSIGQPTDYGYSEKWDLSELPMFPSAFKIYPIVSKNDNDNVGLQKQRDLISELINRDDVDEIICATDAGREGELIFRYIYNANNCTKPIKRLWISSMTEEGISQGMASLKPGEEYENLYQSAIARAKADWIVGMNLSRLYSLLDNCMHKVGRVKTPVLNLIVTRDTAIKNFVKTPYYKVILNNGAVCTEEFPTGELAEKAKSKCEGATASVIEAEIKERTENRPLLHSLGTLQQEANDVYGITAGETLKAAQSLYEKKLLTYPRTDSNYLSEDMKPLLEQRVESLENYCAERVAALLEQGLTVDNRIINNSELTDHHAIIPEATKVSSAKLNENEKHIYELVVNRFLCALDKPYKYYDAHYEFWAEDYTFVLNNKTPIDMGWKKWEKKASDAEQEEPTAEITYKKEDVFDIKSVTVKECEKQPPKYYTDSSLISAMINIDNAISDSELKGYVKGKGLGTSATRANIIDELVANQYIYRKGKQLRATDFGIEFINSIPESVKSVERTAEWEQVLESIASGECDESKLLDDIKRFVQLTVNSEQQNERKLSTTNRQEKVSLGKCPRCGKDVYEGKLNYYCESGKDGCGFAVWKQSKFYLSEIKSDDMIKLLNGKSIKLKAKNQKNETYTADYILDDTGTYVNFKRVVQEKVSLGKCPRCGKDVYEGKLNYYCESGKDGCGFAMWKQNKYPAVIITAKHVKDFLAKGKATILSKKLDGSKVSKTYMLDDTGTYVNIKVEE